MIDPIIQCHRCSAECHIDECREYMNGDRIFNLCEVCRTPKVVALLKNGWNFARKFVSSKFSPE